MSKTKVNTKTKSKITKTKTTKKVAVKKEVKPSTKPMERKIFKGDSNYPQSKSEQVRCDNVAYLMKEIMGKVGEKKLPLRNFRVNGQFYGKRYFKKYQPVPKVKTFIDSLVKELDVGGII